MVIFSEFFHLAVELLCPNYCTLFGDTSKTRRYGADFAVS